MKFILVIIITIGTFSLQAQSRFSLTLNNSVGLIQLQERAVYRIGDCNKYTPRYGLGLSASVKLFNTDLEIGAGILYSWSSFPIFVGGFPLFAGHRVGFPIIHLNNNHWEGRFEVRHPFIKWERIKIGGLLGVDVGWPDFLRETGNFVEGFKYFSDEESDMRLEYEVSLSNIRNSVAIRSGVYLEAALSEYVALNFTLSYRWGLIQSVDYTYEGKIYFNDSPNALEDGFEKFFSNSGAFLDIGLKWTLVAGKSLRK